MTLLSDLLDGTTDPGHPFVTYYDAENDERIELSVTSFTNWVEKTANFLVDDLDAELGTRVRIALPTHWESLIWILATWKVGAVVCDHEAEIAVVGPEGGGDEPTRTALSLRPMGMPFTVAPSGTVDYNANVLGHGDHFIALEPPSDDHLAIDLDGLAMTHREVHEQSPRDSRRVLITPGTIDRDCKLLVSAARDNGSLVIVAGANPAQTSKILESEQAECL